jgi:hypothetical protein
VSVSGDAAKCRNGVLGSVTDIVEHNGSPGVGAIE